MAIQLDTKNLGQINHGESTKETNTHSSELPILNNEKANNNNQSYADTLNITADADALLAIEAKLNHAATIDTAKIEKIKHAILNGEYHIDADKLAEKIMAFETDLLYKE